MSKPGDTGRCVERERSRHAGRDVRAHHPDRRERAGRCRSARVRVHRSRTGGWLAPSRETYTVGLAAVDDAARARSGKRFVDLAPAEQDAVLPSLEETPFFALVRTHTIQGTFCDPAYGGNANFVGWDLIGYPGVRLNVTAADQRMGSPVKPIRRSAYDYAMFAAESALAMPTNSETDRTSSSSGWAPPEAWLRCRSRRPDSRSSASKPAHG